MIYTDEVRLVHQRLFALSVQHLISFSNGLNYQEVNSDFVQSLVSSLNQPFLQKNYGISRVRFLASSLNLPKSIYNLCIYSFIWHMFILLTRLEVNVVVRWLITDFTCICFAAFRLSIIRNVVNYHNHLIWSEILFSPINKQNIVFKLIKPIYLYYI